MAAVQECDYEKVDGKMSQESELAPLPAWSAPDAWIVPTITLELPVNGGRNRSSSRSGPSVSPG